MAMQNILKSSTMSTGISFTGLRCLSIFHPRLAVDKGMLSKLRKQTGIPFINCKKALEKHDNDFEKAKKWLQEQAQKEGWARATKLQTRPMSQGLVAVTGDHKHVTLLEVNCETDFVARNEKFIKMVTKLAEECDNYFTKQPEKKINLKQEGLNQLVSSEQSMLADIVALNVGNLGENMALRRASFLRASTDSLICSYVHPSTSSKKNQKLQLGKYGAVVELKQNSNLKSSEEAVMDIKELGSHLCQHIVGMSPKSLGEFSIESKGDSQSPEIVEDGSESSDSSADEKENEELLSQEFLLDTSMTVGELAYLNGVEVKDFVRFACGEELDGEKE